MARVERPEIGTEMYAVFEHLYSVQNRAGPLLEYCVCKGTVRGFFTGGYTEVRLLFTGPDGFPQPGYQDSRGAMLEWAWCQYVGKQTCFDLAAFGGPET